VLHHLIGERNVLMIKDIKFLNFADNVKLAGLNSGTQKAWRIRP
jgi:hypothetical protein